MIDSRIHKQLPALFELARDRSEPGRLALAEKLAEVFLTDHSALTSHEEQMVGELIEELLRSDNPAIRQALVERFATALQAPRQIALRIGNGPIEIAHTLLTANENLQDEDLVTIISSKGADHAAAIAKRKEISEVVADALVTTGDFGIMLIVAQNMGAKLSPKALDVLVDSARLTAMLQKPLLDRPELNAEKAAQLFWWTARDLRRATLERFGFGPGKLDAALKSAIDSMLDAHLLQKEDTYTMLKLADWLEDRGALDIKILPQLLRAGHYRLFSVLLCRLARVDLKLVDLMMSAPGGRFLVILCRAIGVEKSSFVSIFLMSRGGRPDEHVVHPQELTLSLAAFDRLDQEKAQTLLALWQKDPSDLMNRLQNAEEESS